MLKTVIFTYRYFWKFIDSSEFCVKIVSDTAEGVAEFETRLLSLPNLDRVGREYLHEFDVSKMTRLETIYDSQKGGFEKDEKI